MLRIDVLPHSVYSCDRESSNRDGCSKRGLGGLTPTVGNASVTPRLAFYVACASKGKGIWHDYFEVLLQTANQSLLTLTLRLVMLQKANADTVETF